MSGALAGLLGANALLLAAGLGLLPLLGVARSGRHLLARAGLGYLVGIAAGGVASATLALVRVPFGWPALVIFAGLTLALGARRLTHADGSRSHEQPPRLSRADVAITVVFALVLLGVLVRAARSFAITPLVHWDAWAIWTMKARALASLGGAEPSFFADTALAGAHPRYPLLLPSLEAIDIRAMGGIDSQLIHLQFVLLAIAFAAALAALLWDRVPALLLWPSLFAIVCAPAFIHQLSTAYADIPLAIVFGAGVTAAGRWLLTEESWAVNVAALMFAATLLTKNEGTLLVVAALAALAVTIHRRQARSLLVCAVASFSAVIPWWIYIAWHGLPRDDYRLTDLVRVSYVADQADRGPPALRAFADQLLSIPEWTLLVPFALTALLVAVLAGSLRLPAYVLILSGFTLFGLTMIYVIATPSIDYMLETSAHRVVAPLVVAGAAIAPLALSEALWPPGARFGPKSPPEAVLRRASSSSAGRLGRRSWRSPRASSFDCRSRCQRRLDVIGIPGLRRRRNEPTEASVAPSVGA